MTAPSDWCDISDHWLWLLRTDPRLIDDPIEPIEAKDPMPPIDANDPMLATENAEPVDPIDMIELVDHRDHFELAAMPSSLPTRSQAATRRTGETGRVYYLARGLGPRRIHAPLRLFGFGGHSWIRILLLIAVVLLLVLIARNRR